MRKSLNKVNKTLINCLIWHFCFLSPDFYFPFQTISPEKKGIPRTAFPPPAPRVLDRGMASHTDVDIVNLHSVTLAKNGVQSLLHGFVVQR